MKHKNKAKQTNVSRAGTMWYPGYRYLFAEGQRYHILGVRLSVS